MAESRRRFPDFDLTRSWALDKTPAQPGESFAAYLTRIGFTADQIRYVRRAWGNATAEALENISAIGALEDVGVFPSAAYPDLPDAGEGDFRVVEGYDRIPAHLAQGIDVRLNKPVARVEWGQSPVRIFTENAEIYEAERVLITLPLGVLQAGHIQFDPPLPAEKCDAIHGIIMGEGMKLVYKFPAHLMPADTHAIYADGAPPMWWTSTPSNNEQVWTGFATGEWAREVRAHGEDTMLDYALETIRREVGQPNLTPLATHVVHWTRDPFALGAYSVMPPGADGAREILAKPIGERLFWAGEATAPQPWASTVHGAFFSGQRAARELLASQS